MLYLIGVSSKVRSCKLRALFLKKKFSQASVLSSIKAQSRHISYFSHNELSEWPKPRVTVCGTPLFPIRFGCIYAPNRSNDFYVFSLFRFVCFHLWEFLDFCFSIRISNVSHQFLTCAFTRTDAFVVVDCFFLSA